VNILHLRSTFSLEYLQGDLNFYNERVGRVDIAV
jgi:hypothetical protein